MKFINEKGKVLSEKEVIDSGYGHLLENAPFLLCDRCGRKSYDLIETVCSMPQPSGRICDGHFKPIHDNARNLSLTHSKNSL